MGSTVGAFAARYYSLSQREKDFPSALGKRDREQRRADNEMWVAINYKRGARSNTDERCAV
jgi:hypothetical protein